jgi:ribonuclease HII
MKSANFLFEQSLWNQGYQTVAGVDEVGRGCIAGPVVAAAVCFPPRVKFPEDLYDSKLLTPDKRERLAILIAKFALSLGVSVVETEVINKKGIVTASQLAFRRAIEKLDRNPDYFLVDAFYIKNIRKAQQLPIVKGDQISSSIAAASIIAKVYRDRLMTQLHESVPQYRFDLHKGYATSLHQEMVRQNGLSPHHRTRFNLSNIL